VLRYNRGLMQSILHGRCNVAEVVSATVLPLEETAEGYKAFDTRRRQDVRARSARGAGRCFGEHFHAFK